MPNLSSSMHTALHSPMHTGMLTQVPVFGASPLSDPDFQVFSNGSVTPEYGTGSETFTRAGTPLCQGHDGTYVAVAANEVRMVGLRRSGGAWLTTDASGNPLYPTVTNESTAYSITRAAQYTNWQASTAYSLGDRVYPESYSNIVVNPDEDHYFECTTAGTSHATTEPTWDTTTIDSSTTSDGTVTWTYKGLATYKGVLLEPAATNLITDSRDLTGYLTIGTPTVTYNQTGITGEANTATYLDDSNGSTIERVYTSFAVTADVTHVLRAFFKKDADVSRFPALRSTLSGGTAKQAWAWLNTSTGATTVSEADAANMTATSHLINVGGVEWWVLTAKHTDTGTNTSAVPSIIPAAGTVIGTSSAAATGSCIVGQLEFYDNTTLEAIQYSSPIFTSGASSSRTTELGGLSYNIANYTDDASSVLVDLVYLNAPSADSGILSVNGGQADYISHDGTGFNSDDGTNVATITQAITAGTMYRIGQRQTTTKQQMSEGGANGTEGTYDNARTATAVTVIEGTGAIVKNAVIANADLSIASINTLTGTD